ncbi:MAG: methylisocitrate lyase, partial [Deltaproteobacteria bacterium CG_4_10_14_0_2_um_filter_43_8]
GAGLANAEFARPDIGLTTCAEAQEHARRIDAAVGIPGISDVDTGFEDEACMMQSFQIAGLAGVHMEDQVDQKKCGHLEGKQLVSVDEMCERIHRAQQAKTDADFLLIARTDAAAVEGFDAAVSRAKAYVKAGADAVFPEAMRSEEDFKAMRKAIDVPLLANMTEFGKTPYYSVSQFEQWGYNMVIFPMTLFRVVAKSMQEALAELRSTGTQKGFLDTMQTREDLYKTLKYIP